MPARGWNKGEEPETWRLHIIRQASVLKAHSLAARFLYPRWDVTTFLSSSFRNTDFLSPLYLFPYSSSLILLFFSFRRFLFLSSNRLMFWRWQLRFSVSALPIRRYSRAFPQLFQRNSETVHSLGHYRLLLTPFNSPFTNAPSIWEYSSIPRIGNSFFSFPKRPGCLSDPSTIQLNG